MHITSRGTKRQAKRMREAQRVFDMFSKMMNSPAAIEFKNIHGSDALIPGWGFTYSELVERMNTADNDR